MTEGYILFPAVITMNKYHNNFDASFGFGSLLGRNWGLRLCFLCKNNKNGWEIHKKFYGKTLAINGRLC
jgi:hypothetical protein